MHLANIKNQPFRPPPYDGERGQATIALVGVLVLACVAVLGISVLGQAMVHRSHARNAADAVALANAVDPAAVAPLRQWYSDRGIGVELHGERTVAYSGPSQAAAWAAVARSDGQPAPALVAIIARAEQLLDVIIDPVAWNGISVDLSSLDAAVVRQIAADLGLCEVETESRTSTFELC